MEYLKASGLTTTIITDTSERRDKSLGRIRWNWQESLSVDGQTLRDGGEMYYDNNSTQFVSTISPQLYTSFKLADIIRAYGEPEYVLAEEVKPYPEATTLYYLLGVVYISKGFALDAIGSAETPITLTQDTIFGRPLFFGPSYAAFSRLERDINAYFATKYLVKWQGFRDFGYYCRNAENQGRPCKLVSGQK